MAVLRFSGVNSICFPVKTAIKSLPDSDPRKHKSDAQLADDIGEQEAKQCIVETRIREAFTISAAHKFAEFRAGRSHRGAHSFASVNDRNHGLHSRLAAPDCRSMMRVFDSILPLCLR